MLRKSAACDPGCVKMGQSLLQPALRPAKPGDRDLIHRWLRNPEVSRWWGNLASAEAEISLALESGSALCRIIETGGLPIGYAQAADCGLTSSPPIAAVPAGTWNCHVFIGSEAHRGRGAGQAALDLLVGEVFASTLAVACMIAVPVRNERAARAHEAAGFRWVAVAEDPIHGPSWVMLRERPPR